jgi:hypothetical protein
MDGVANYANCKERREGAAQNPFPVQSLLQLRIGAAKW